LKRCITCLNVPTTKLREYCEIENLLDREVEKTRLSLRNAIQPLDKDLVWYVKRLKR
jgi:hypothetical protein